MEMDQKKELRRMSRDNALSVLKKILVGSLVIAFVGICAYLSLIILMSLF